MNKIKHIIKTTFPWIGWLGFILCIIIIYPIITSKNDAMNQQSQTFATANLTAQPNQGSLSAEQTKTAIDRFAKFLEGIGSSEFIESEINNVYAENAYLNDTLKTLHNREEIKQHFVKTSKAMSAYSVNIEDISSTESIGITYVVFDQEGKAILHQDYWDSTVGFFEHIPIIGGTIRLAKKKL